jgi:hypothetical protein
MTDPQQGPGKGRKDDPNLGQKEADREKAEPEEEEDHEEGDDSDLGQKEAEEEKAELEEEGGGPNARGSADRISVRYCRGAQAARSGGHAVVSSRLNCSWISSWTPAIGMSACGTCARPPSSYENRSLRAV